MEEIELETSDLDYFSNFTSSDKNLRIMAVRGLLKRMRYESRNNHHNLYLICKRLVRGLGGSKAIFRQGCFSCTVGFMSLLPSDFKVSIFEELIKSELHPAGNNSKQEKGEAYLGQILAYGAMIVTGLIYRESEEYQEEVFTKIFQLGRKRSYLHHVSYVFMTEMLKNSDKEFIPDGFIDDVRDLNDNPLDKLNFLLALENKSFKTSTIKKALGTKSLFDLANATTIIGYIKKSKTSVMLEHNFISEITKAVINHPKFFTLFWSSLTEQKHLKNETENTNGIVKFSSSDDAVTLQLCCSLLKSCIESKNLELGKEIWSKNLILLLLRNVKKNKSIVQMFLSDFCLYMKTADDEVKLDILRLTLFEQGILDFDTLTNSKTVLILTNNLSFNGLTELASLYKSVIENKKEVVNVDLKKKGVLICLNYYTKIINSHTCYEEIPWRLSQLIFLLKLGFFKQDVHLNRELVNHVQEAFLTSLGHRFPNFESFQKVLNALFFELNTMLNTFKDNILINFTDDMLEAWEKAVSLNEEMVEEIESESKEVITVLKIILQYMSILILKESSTAIINIQDLYNIFLEIKEGGKTMWIEVLIDLFLNLLSKPNYHHRHLIRCIFKSLCQHLTPESFNQIIEVLELSYDPRNILEHSDIIKSDDSEAESDSDESKDNSEAEEDEDGDGDEITANEKLRLELRNVLTIESDADSVDLDDMDEDEGRHLNETLGNIFKSNMKRKSPNHFSKYQNQLAHFRIRIIDLLEMCTEVVLPFSYWLRAALPLIELYASTISQKQLDNLRSRINCCIKKLNSSKVIQEENCVKEAVNALVELFKKLFKLSGVYCDMKMELCSMIKFILKSAKPFNNGLKQKHLKNNEIFQLFKKHFEDFFNSKNNAPVTLFNNMISIGWDGVLALFPNLINLIFDDAVKLHKRILGVKMVETFIKTPQYFDGHLESYYEYYLTNNAESFRVYIINTIEKVCSEKESNLKFYAELWSLLVLIFTKQNQNKFPELINQEKFKELLNSKMKEFPIMKGLCKQNFKKLCNFLNIVVTNSKEITSPQKELKKDSVQKNLNKRKKKDKMYEGLKKKAKRLKPNNVEVPTVLSYNPKIMSSPCT
ncbi:uncharacterized protein Mybbp1A [Halyomorpha halys]|uniref:uncharacterized protein Mybbp1A n=1 Tax=Halyomorpha halys TaxID=286706 RepID=UPI0006D4F48E|nr:uncharacterized protein LOC106681194 [Halyomorpha halys]